MIFVVATALLCDMMGALFDATETVAPLTINENTYFPDSFPEQEAHRQ